MEKMMGKFSKIDTLLNSKSDVSMVMQLEARLNWLDDLKLSNNQLIDNRFKMLEERLKHREEAHEKCLEVDAAQERSMKNDLRPTWHPGEGTDNSPGY